MSFLARASPGNWQPSKINDFPHARQAIHASHASQLPQESEESGDLHEESRQFPRHKMPSGTPGLPSRGQRPALTSGKGPPTQERPNRAVGRSLSAESTFQVPSLPGKVEMGRFCALDRALRACLRPREGDPCPKVRRNAQNPRLIVFGYRFAPVRNRSLAGKDMPAPNETVWSARVSGDVQQ